MSLARIQSYFPTLLYAAPLINDKKKLAGLLKEVKSDSMKIFEQDNEGHSWSASHYANGYTSYSSLSNLHEINSNFIDLRVQLDKHVEAYAKALGFDRKCQLRMQSCWLNIMPPGASHSLHLHPLSIVSGTFYVEIPKGSGVIKFEDPRISKMMACPPRRDGFESAGFAKLPPTNGEVILFESWLRHEVELNRGEGVRISVSFNYA